MFLQTVYLVLKGQFLGVSVHFQSYVPELSDMLIGEKK
jgi:hypothetical protein